MAQGLTHIDIPAAVQRKTELYVQLAGVRHLPPFLLALLPCAHAAVPGWGDARGARAAEGRAAAAGGLCTTKHCCPWLLTVWLRAAWGSGCPVQDTQVIPCVMAIAHAAKSKGEHVGQRRGCAVHSWRPAAGASLECLLAC